MKKITIYFTLFTTLLLGLNTAFGQTVIISEVVDPSDQYEARYVEIYNATTATVDLTNWQIRRYANSSTTSADVNLSGTIASGETYTIATNASDFNAAYGFDPNLANGYITGNGDDVYELTDGTNVIDIYGVIGTDGTGTWEYLDSIAVRNTDVCSGNTTWTASEWTIQSGGISDATPNVQTCDCPVSCTPTTWNGTAWSDGNPDNTKKAIIDGDYFAATNGDITACELELTANGDLTIEASQFVSVQGNIVNEGLITVAYQGSLVQIDDTATVTGGGFYDVEVKTTTMADPRYTYFSAPTSGATMAAFSSWAQTDRMFGWDGTAQDWAAVTTTTAMTPGLGYIVRQTNSATGIFTTDFDTSAFNNGVITAPLYFNTDGTDDDNALVGNPYPSAIGTADLLSANTDANAFYFWAHETSDPWTSAEYKIWDASGDVNGAPATISTGQGFFVTATAAGTLTFNNALRLTTDNDTFLRPTTSNLDKVWLNLMSNTNVRSQILVSFNPICSDGFDSQYDASRFETTNAVSLSSNGVGANTENLAIQTRGELNDDTTIPLNVSINESNITSATISIDHFENLEDTSVLLVDNLLGNTHDLKLSDYTFAVSETGVINDRFELLFNRGALNTTEVTNENYLNVNQSETAFVLTSNKSIAQVAVYNLLGQMVDNQQAKTNTVQIKNNYSVGTVLIIKATLENGNVISKKVIKL